jgi:solute:Na+ symporter, SSS family
MGSAIGRDVVEKIFPKTGLNTMMIARLGIVFGVMISVFIGYKLPIGIIARGTAIFFGICAATFLPSYLASLYWKRVTRQGALWSILSGLSTSAFALGFLHQKESQPLGICKAIFGTDFLIDKFPWMIIDPMMIALPVSVVVLIVVSLMTRPPEEEFLKKCFK